MKEVVHSLLTVVEDAVTAPRISAGEDRNSVLQLPLTLRNPFSRRRGRAGPELRLSLMIDYTSHRVPASSQARKEGYGLARPIYTSFSVHKIRCQGVTGSGSKVIFKRTSQRLLSRRFCE